MNTFRTIALACLSLLALTTVSGPAGSQSPEGCAPTLTIQDAGLRAKFAQFDRTRPIEFRQVCMMYRETVAGFGR